MKHPIAYASIISLSLLALAGCGKGQQAQQQMPPPNVGVVTVQPQSTTLNKDLVGRLSAYRSADVRARVSGLLLKRVYKEGSDVKQGQLLFQVDPAPYKAALDSAQANLVSAKATYTNAHVTADRDRSLIGQGYVSRAQLDNDEASERSAAASVSQAEANVQTARVNLGYTNVTSPIDGRAGEQQVTEGAIVGNGTADAGASSTLLTTVEQIDPMYVNFTMSASDLEQMRRAQNAGHVTLTDTDKATVQLVLPDGSLYDQKGTLDFSDTSVNPATGAVNLRGIVPNSQHALLPGLYVTLKVQLGQQNNVFLIPQPALLRDTASAYVYVVGPDGKATRKNVSADQSSGSNWIVTNGLSAGDQVIVTGVQGVKDGAPVKASAWQPNQNPAGASSSAPNGQPAASASK